MKKVLVLTYEEDPHTTSVCNALRSQGAHIFRVDTDKPFGSYGINFDTGSGKYLLYNEDQLETIDKEWNIWNRRVMDPSIPEDFPKDLEDIVFTEARRTWEGMLFSHKGRVVNRPQANFAANNKVDQLCFAREYGNGIHIPETILTNIPDVLRGFFDTRGKICHKLQKVAVVERYGERLLTYTNIVDHDAMKHAHLIERNPSLFQTYIDKEYELRITAMDNKVVGIAIHSQDSEVSRVDFRRYDFGNVKYEKVNLPQNVEKFCRDISQHYGLSFCEIDMILSKEGEYFFLEINPNGQWLWLQLMSKYNLTEDVAENLLI